MRLLSLLLLFACCASASLARSQAPQQPSESRQQPAESRQQPPPQPDEPPVVEAVPDESGGAEIEASELAPTASDLELIDRLLEEDEAALEAGFVYDAGGRRDPFVTLLVTRDEPERLGPRPEGIPGFLTDEVSVVGIWMIGREPVAQVRTADDPKQYLLHEGDQLYDGEVVRIQYSRGQGGEVVFRQRVDDPSAPRPFREIVKRLEP